MMLFVTLYQKTFRWICKLLPMNLKSRRNSLAIVTGANSPFYESSRDNLLKTISKYENHAEIYYWDLGLSETEVAELQRLFPFIHIIPFDYDKYPYFYALEYHNYAFKSACIYETMKIAQTHYLFWLDAGCAIKDSLKAVRVLLKIYGFYSPNSSTSISALTYPTVIKDFLPERFIHIAKSRMLSGGIVGVNLWDFSAVQIIREWYQLTSDLSLLTPEGSNRENHRQDQSLLSLVYYSRKKCLPLLQRRYYEFMVHLNKGK